jgi:hypothetical protein
MWNNPELEELAQEIFSIIVFSKLERNSTYHQVCTDLNSTETERTFVVGEHKNKKLDLLLRGEISCQLKYFFVLFLFLFL